MVLLLSSVIGCTSSKRTVTNRPKPESIFALNSSEIGLWSGRYQEILSSRAVDLPHRMPENQILDFTVLYLLSSREFDSSEGPDGYLIQIIPIGPNEKPKPFPTDVTIFLQALPCRNDSGSCPYLRVWRISSEKLGETWRRTRLLDGYVLPLHWGESGLPEGDYRFQIVLESTLGKQTYYSYRELTISDKRKSP